MPDGNRVGRFEVLGVAPAWEGRRDTSAGRGLVYERRDRYERDAVGRGGVGKSGR